MELEFELSRHWWAWALRGVLAILFGVAVFLWPLLFWLAAAYIFAAYALISGMLAVIVAVTGHGRAGRWWALLLEGLVGIVFGVLTFAWPLATAITELVLLYLIAFQYIFVGVFQVIAAFRLRQHVRNEWLLALSGVLSIVLGAAFVIFPPIVGATVVAWWVAAYSIVFGILLLGLGFRLRSLARHESRLEPVTVP